MDRHETYTELLRDHSALIWSMCRNTAPGDYERCRDLFQDVSLRLWQHYDELRSDAKPHERKAWVEWQVRHVLNHAGRRERPVPMSDLPEQPDIDALDKAEIRTLVNDLLTQLNPDERQLLQMRMDGYSAGEIAKEMGLSRDTVYQRMHRTLTKARRILLVLFLLFMASSITVAVVPSWRQMVFGGGNPSATDTAPSSTASPSTPVPAPVADSTADSTADSIPAHRAWVPTQPIQHLIAQVLLLQQSLQWCPLHSPDGGIRRRYLYRDGTGGIGIRELHHSHQPYPATHHTHYRLVLLLRLPFQHPAATRLVARHRRPRLPLRQRHVAAPAGLL